MRKIVIEVDGSYIAHDKNGAPTGVSLAGWDFEDSAGPSAGDESIIRLVSLGVTAEELIKMKANGLI